MIWSLFTAWNNCYNITITIRTWITFSKLFCREITRSQINGVWTMNVFPVSIVGQQVIIVQNHFMIPFNLDRPHLF